ncbi:MAG TPA: FlgD immunoglobulin-like domain containing protein [Candidatus Eisenbacteria bacterium]|jgi:hypothetical protein
MAAGPNRNAVFLAAALCCVSASPRPAHALVRFDFEQPYLVLPGRYMKDHSFVRRGDEWHCFMIAGSDDSISWRLPGNEVSFAHASTKDFRHWTIHPDVCSVGTGSWDERNIWAPKIIPWKNRYRMYYTGVDSNVVQRMGLAVSDDLFEWAALPVNPLYHPDTTWADWCEGEWSNCRDPDVSVIGGAIYALNTASTKSGLGAVDCAVSRDGISWTDVGPLFVNGSKSVPESIQLLRRSSTWYLFFNEEGESGLFLLRAPALTGPWTGARRRLLAYGQPAEIFGHPPGSLISRCGRYRDATGRIKYVLRVDPLLWDASGDPAIGDDDALWRDWSPARLDDPDPGFGETGREVLSTDLAFAEQPTFGENPSLRGENEVVGAVGNSWIGTRERYRGPLAGTPPGCAVGDVAVGAVRSRDFRISGPALSFLIGGDRDPERLFLALRDARSHAILARATGTGSETLQPRVWRTDSLYGRLVYLEIVDASPSGHINLDEIIESDSHGHGRAGTFPGILLDAVPNPFRGATAATVRVDRRTPLTIGVYDVSGRLVRPVFSGSAGTGLFRFGWDGDCEDGSPAAAGTYFLRVDAGGAVETVKVVRIR